jgi:hypothetical protein
VRDVLTLYTVSTGCLYAVHRQYGMSLRCTEAVRDVLTLYTGSTGCPYVAQRQYGMSLRCTQAVRDVLNAVHRQCEMSLRCTQAVRDVLTLYTGSTGCPYAAQAVRDVLNAVHSCIDLPVCRHGQFFQRSSLEYDDRPGPLACTSSLTVILPHLHEVSTHSVISYY